MKRTGKLKKERKKEGRKTTSKGNLTILHTTLQGDLRITKDYLARTRKLRLRFIQYGKIKNNPLKLLINNDRAYRSTGDKQGDCFLRNQIGWLPLSFNRGSNSEFWAVVPPLGRQHFPILYVCGHKQPKFQGILLNSHIL